MVDSSNSSVTVPVREVNPSLVSYTNVIYALHSLSVLIGLTSPVTVVGSFVFGIPSIVAVIMNYARQAEARGTYLESHFSWQIRTFWFAVLWGLIIFGVSLVLMLILIGFVTLPAGLALLGVWVIYRVIRGWLALRERRPVQL
jgi:uncharacterized membrane protein